MRGTVHKPEVKDDQNVGLYVDCPNCEGIIVLGIRVCGRCGARIARLYRRNGSILKMTYRTNGKKPAKPDSSLVRFSGKFPFPVKFKRRPP